MSAHTELRRACVACFLSIIQSVADKTGKREMVRNAVIHTQVHIGEPESMGGYGFQVDIQVEGVEDMELIQAAHEVSRVTVLDLVILYVC